MRSAAIAEWILSLVAPPDRAASTTGDLLEEAPARGALWFWSSVLRTACSQIWRDLSASPWKMVRLAIWGLTAQFVIGWLLCLSLVEVWYILTEPVPREFPLWVLRMIVGAVAPFLVGWMVARRSANRELAAVFSAALAVAAWYFFLLYCTVPPRQVTPNMQVSRSLPEHPFAQFCASTLSMAAGAILFRIRANKEARHA